jgi:hypothetical protein
MQCRSSKALESMPCFRGCSSSRALFCRSERGGLRLRGWEIWLHQRAPMLSKVNRSLWGAALAHTLASCFGDRNGLSHQLGCFSQGSRSQPCCSWLWFYSQEWLSALQGTFFPSAPPPTEAGTCVATGASTTFWTGTGSSACSGSEIPASTFLGLIYILSSI